jgi:hypothetical protein
VHDGRVTKGVEVQSLPDLMNLQVRMERNRKRAAVDARRSKTDARRRQKAARKANRR